MDATADVRLVLINAVAALGSELARIVRFQPGEIDGEHVQRVVRIGELEPLAREVGGLFAAGTDGGSGGGGGWKTQVNLV